MPVKEKILLDAILPIAETAMGTNAHKWYRQIGQMGKWSREQVLAWQQDHLHRFIQHAYAHTTYYHRLFDQLGLKPQDIQTAEDLQKLPVIDKSIVNAHHDELIPDNIASFKYRKGRTGGTTGEPMQYLCDEDTWGYVTAAKIYNWKRSGYHYGDAFVALGSSSLFSKKASLPRRIYDKIRNEHGLNSVSLTDDVCAQYAEYIQRKDIHYLYGYAASIYIFTQYVAHHHIDLSQIRAVFTTSENLTDENRCLIEATYDCSVMDCYGARDAGITAYETKYHHYCVGYNAIAEIINPIAPNTGTLLSTNFLNYSFPLIRYQFGDEVELAQSGSDDYNGQVITKVLGRTSDVLRLENGRSLTATGLSMIMKEFDIVAFNFSKTSVNEVKLQIEPIQGKYSKDQEKKIQTTVQRYIGIDGNLVIEYVDYFEPLANGKRRYFYI